MYKVIIPESIHDIIKNFIKVFRDRYLDLYSDTWIYYEDLIRKNYIEISKKFYKEIFYSLETNFKWDILWRKDTWNWKFKVIITVWNFRLFIDYSEDNTKKIRFIESIEFHKR